MPNLIEKFLTLMQQNHAANDSSTAIPKLPYHPVVLMPASAKLLDLTKQPLNDPPIWSIGKYNEARAIYTQALFNTPGKSPRNIHMGIDLGAPQGVAVHAFWDGKVIFAGENTDPGDYGPVIVTEHKLSATTTLYALHGHLSRNSLLESPVNREFKRGAVLGWIGGTDVNGGWFPHLHFQLSFKRPLTHDMPGVVNKEDHKQALRDYPDPRRVMRGVRLPAAKM